MHFNVFNASAAVAELQENGLQSFFPSGLQDVLERLDCVDFE